MSLGSLSAQTLHVVSSGNFFYNPSSLTINVGDTVRWTNAGGFHDVNATTNTITGQSFGNPESFASTATSNNFLYEHVFTIAGTYNYDCSVGQHAANGMVGTVIVNATTTSTKNIQNSTVQTLNAFYNAGTQAVQLSFDLKNQPNNAVVSVYNITGQVVQTNAINAVKGENQNAITLEGNMTNGIYFVQLQVDGAIETREIIVQ